MQFAEGLSDRQTAEAVRSRIDWKYALGLELTDSGFDHTVLKEFRKRLLAGGQERQLLDLMLKKLQEQQLLKSRGKQRTDSTHVLAAIRQLNRLELVGETLRHALNELADVAPQWLLSVVSQDWFDRYAIPFERYRLPKNKSEQAELALTIGIDGEHLLSKLYELQTSSELSKLPSVEILRQVWLQQYTWVDGSMVWRLPSTTGLPACKQMIASPYDPQARNRTKRDTNWTGYTVHLTETCDQDCPHLITNVETTPATTHDGAMTPKIHAHLAQKDLLPEEHLLDMAYVDAENLVSSSKEYQVDLMGKVPPDNSWQKRTPEGLDLSCFAIDWEQEQVQCPIGQWSRSWRERTEHAGKPVIEVRFDKGTCAACPIRQQCTRAKQEPRLLKFRLREEHESLQLARQRQETTEFKEKYAQRAGIEGTISQGTRAFNLRRSRYLGLAKTHLQHIATAAAINLSRLMDWWKEKPLAQTRVSSFAALENTANAV